MAPFEHAILVGLHVQAGKVFRLRKHDGWQAASAREKRTNGKVYETRSFSRDTTATIREVFHNRRARCQFSAPAARLHHQATVLRDDIFDEAVD